MSRKQYIVVHHTAGPRNQTAEEIKHYLRTGRPDLGGLLAYAKIIEIDGSVHDDAPEDAGNVAHATGFNTTGIGVCLCGNFSPGHDKISVNDPQFKALIQTCAILCKRHKIPADNIIGHVDTFDRRGVKRQKDCPGAVHELLPELRKRVGAYL